MSSNPSNRLIPCQKILFRGRPFNSWGGGDFEKKFPASACRKKKIACSTNVIEKNSCTAVRKKKKCCKAISSFGGL